VSEIHDALFRIQKAAPSLRKDARNPHFGNTYITLDAVMDAVKPLLHAEGILIMQLPAAAGPEPALTTVLYHTESETYVSGTMPMVLDRQGPQAVGSAITYYRRYSILSMLGLVADEDDDAESAHSTTDQKDPGAVASGGSIPSSARF